MKKQTKNKINKIWQKIRKPLMILSFVGNILFLLFIIIGCVGSKKQTQQANAEDSAPIFTLRDTTWKFSDTIRYDFNGNDLLNVNYNENPNRALNFYDETYSTYYIGIGFERVAVRQNRMYFSCYGEYGVVLKETACTFTYNVRERVWECEFADSDYETIHIISGDSANQIYYEDQSLIQWFYDNATLIGDYEVSNFTFLSQINYNGPFGQPLDSTFINANNTGSYTLTIDLPYFACNGQLFNQIKCYYLNGQSMQYITANGTTAVNDNNQTWYFLQMEFICTSMQDSAIRHDLAVNYRKFVVGNSTSLTNGSTWIGSSYRFLKFQQALTPEQRTSLECFNNDTYSGFSGDTTNVGLSNVFGLLGQAFVSLRSLLSIELLPNITIGLLVFMPLVVGIILAIIWIVKR